MLRKKKMLTTALCAGGVVLSAVMAEDTTSEATTTADGTIVSQPFETAVDDVTKLNDATALSGTWAGYGSVTNQEGDAAGYTKPSGVGSPINDSTDKLYLSVDGYVTCTAATTENKPATVDMMIQIAKPDEALALPTGESTDDIQIAVGVDTDGSLKVYCKDKGENGAVAWYSLDETPYNEGEWHRVSFTFDYANQTCQIRLDGEPLMTKHGALTSDGKGTSDGSWYKLNTTAKNLKEVKVVGSTAIDEVVIKQADLVADALPALADVGGSTGSVPNQWIAEQGITRAQAEAGTAPDDSGMTVEAKYLTGLPIGDGKTYAITAMKMEGEGNNLTATLTVPAMTPPEKVGETNVGRQNVIVYGSDPDSLTKKQVIPSGATTVTLTVNKKTDSGVTKIYYQLKNEEKTDSAATN